MSFIEGVVALPRLGASPDDFVGSKSASVVVAEALRHAILRGALPSGERLRQDAIATRFGVSQMVVREAFKQLANEGFLHAEPRRGVSVAALTVREAEEMTQLRSLLEVQALEWAIPEMKQSDLETAELILDELDRAESTDDTIALNARFHETLYAPARRERTLSIIATLRFHFERYFRFTWEGTSHLARSQREHREILKCCRDRAVEKACVLLRKHILGTGTLLARRLKQLEPVAGSTSAASGTKLPDRMLARNVSSRRPSKRSSA
jgi:DNA-binding GntR family transcriptional regulator